MLVMRVVVSVPAAFMRAVFVAHFCPSIVRLLTASRDYQTDRTGAWTTYPAIILEIAMNTPAARPA